MLFFLLKKRTYKLFKNLKSLNFCLLPFMYKPVKADLEKCRFLVAGFYCISRQEELNLIC